MIYGEIWRFPLKIQAQNRSANDSVLVEGFNWQNSKIFYKLYMLLLTLHRNGVYSCKWILYTDIQNSSKCYRIFKTEFKLEKYIITIGPKYYIPMATFRTSHNRLSIEKGR